MANYKHKFKVGQTVKVISIHTELAAGIGESEKDPVYMVRVPKRGTDLFWTEELSAVRA